MGWLRGVFEQVFDEHGHFMKLYYHFINTAPFYEALLPHLSSYYHDCSGTTSQVTTRAPQAGFELATNGHGNQFYAMIANLDKT